MGNSDQITRCACACAPSCRHLRDMVYVPQIFNLHIRVAPSILNTPNLATRRGIRNRHFDITTSHIVSLAVRGVSDLSEKSRIGPRGRGRMCENQPNYGLSCGVPTANGGQNGLCHRHAPQLGLGWSVTSVTSVTAPLAQGLSAFWGWAPSRPLASVFFACFCVLSPPSRAALTATWQLAHLSVHAQTRRPRSRLFRALVSPPARRAVSSGRMLQLFASSFERSKSILPCMR